jgi:class 3 adenylate cyclase
MRRSISSSFPGSSRTSRHLRGSGARHRARALGAEAAEIGIEIRAGLHTGECELIGDDIGGMCVQLAARVCALAGPHEVLVSRTVKDLVVGSGIRFAERGAHELKGAPGEWELFSVE